MQKDANADGGVAQFYLAIGRPAPSELLEKANNRESLMAAYLIFDVEIHDMARYQEFMAGVKPALEAAGARYLARGGAHTVYEGDWEPRRIVLLEFPSSKGGRFLQRRDLSSPEGNPRRM